MTGGSDLYHIIAQKVRRLPVDHPLRSVVRSVKRASGTIPLAINYVIYRFYQPRTIVVLGMHRSGTSFVTRGINLLGARIGNNLLGQEESNPQGHWEHRLSLRINKRLLKRAGGAWDDPPNSIEASLIVTLRIREFLARLHKGNNTAVWKDPRTLLTFPIWRREMVDYIPVFVFRDPISVARSLRKRDGFSLGKGLMLWVEYNKRLIKIDNNETCSHFVDFDGGVGKMKRSFQRISNDRGLRFTPSVIEFYNEDYRTSDARGDIDGDVKNIYDELKRRSV